MRTIEMHHRRVFSYLGPKPVRTKPYDSSAVDYAMQRFRRMIAVITVHVDEFPGQKFSLSEGHCEGNRTTSPLLGGR